MNKFQSKLSTEIKQFKKQYNVNYCKAKKIILHRLKYQMNTPCEDCDYMYCSNIKNKLVYCKYNS